ncbi:MAG: hypothetical protein AAF990_19945 [Bacteroidota bacterium]
MNVRTLLLASLILSLAIACTNSQKPQDKPEEEKDEFMEAFDNKYQPESIEKGDKAAGEADYKVVMNAEEDPVTQRAKLYDLVMNTHDEVMPRMTEITKLRRTLAQAIRAAKNEENQELEEKLKKEFDKVESANKGMWDWMHSFKHPAPQDPQDEVMKYLEEEMKKVNKVKSDIETAITDGNKFIDDLRNNSTAK